MGNFITPVGGGSGSGGGGGGTDPLAVKKITFQGIDYLPNPAGLIVFPTVVVPTHTSDLINNSGFITSAALPTKVSDLTNDSGFLVSSDLAPVAFSGSYTALIDKPDLSALATAIQTASNVGTGQNIFNAKSGTDLSFKTLIQGANVTFDTTTTPGSIIIASTGGGGGGSGEANTSSSAGTGTSIVLPKSGVDLPFRSFLSSAGLVWSTSTNEITITLDATLQALAALTISSDTLIYGTGPDSFATTPFTSYARTLVDDTNAPTARATLGSTTVGDAVYVAASPLAARTAIGITEKVPAYQQSGTYLNIAINSDGTVNATNQAGTVLKILTVPS